jgi:cytochrome P450
MLSTQNIAEHRWRRRGWERGFAPAQLREYEPRVMRHLDTLLAQLRERVNGEDFFPRPLHEYG